MRKNNSYQNLSDEEISLQIAELDENLLKLKEERKVISKNISEQFYKKRYLVNLLNFRKSSPYDGQYHVKTEFRQKYGKPYSQLNHEEKLQYSREYFKTYKRKETNVD